MIRRTLASVVTLVLLLGTVACTGRSGGGAAVPARTGPAPAATVPRLTGDRYAIGASVAATLFPNGAGTVVIASGDPASFERGQLAASLAGVISKPLLFTDTAALPAATAAAITSLGATRAIIAGGESAVSLAVEAQVAAMGLETSRVGGDDIRSDALEIAKATRDLWRGLYDGKVYVIGGDPPGWQTLYSVAGPAYSGGVPVLLAGTKGLPDDTLSAIEDLAVTKAVLVGDESLISEAVERDLTGRGIEVVRLQAGSADEIAPALAGWANTEG